MAIIIGPAVAAEQDYTQLKLDVANWMNRTDLDAVIPRFIALAEARINSDLRVRQMLATAQLSIVPGAGAALPADWLEFKTVEINGCTLDYMQPDQLAAVLKNGGGGPARWYSIDGGVVQFAPGPSETTAVDVRYYKALPPLAGSSTNWLLLSKPNVYLYAALVEGNLFVKNKDEAASWAGLYDGIMGLLRSEDRRATSSGSPLRMRRR